MSVSTVNEAKQALWSAFSTAWLADTNTLSDNATQIKSIPLYSDNQGAQPGVKRYAVFMVTPGKALQITCGPVGQRTFRQPGIVVAAMFVPLDSGDGDASIMGDEAASFLRGTTIGGNIICRAPYPVRVGEVNGLYRVNVLTDFYYDFTA